MEICQNPELASNLEKILAPTSWANVSSTFGRGWMSLITLLLSGFRSTHMWTAPNFLGTTTIPAHHGVGLLTLEINPVFSILLSSAATRGQSGSGTCRGVNRRGWLCIRLELNFILSTNVKNIGIFLLD